MSHTFSLSQRSMASRVRLGVSHRMTVAMMSRITLALKRHLVTKHPSARSTNTLEWGSVTRPPRIAVHRGRVQYVERASCDASVLAIVSRTAEQEDTKPSTMVGECPESDNLIEMVDLGDADKEVKTPATSEMSV